MSVGAYSFTPASVTKPTKDFDQDPFGMFGGTSMSAPITSGAAALVIQSLNDNSQSYEPSDVKNILMSSAKDLQNDVCTQGTGLVDSLDAIRLVNGEGGVFQVYNIDSSRNLNSILESPMNTLNYTAIGMNTTSISLTDIPQTSWFAGRLNPGDTTSSTFKINNPTNKTLTIEIFPENLKLIKTSIFDGTTEPLLQDSYHNQSKTYRPNYIGLSNLTLSDSTSLESMDGIPEDSSLLVLNANFSFENFMNQTNTMYADDLKISSLYLYDWKDKNKNSDISSDELSLVNRGGSWGTVQELRITNPNEQFENEPIIGIYPVPERYSFWGGSIKQNATSFDYTLSANYFKKVDWSAVTIKNKSIIVPPNQTTEVDVTLSTNDEQKTGIYDGFIKIKSEHQTVNIPVSYDSL